MSRWAMLAPLALVAAAPAPVSGIHAAMDASAAGWNAGDLKTFVAVYAENAIFVTPGGLLRGRAEIARHYAKSFVGGGNLRGRLTFDFLATRPIDPTHRILFARWRLTPAGGAKVETGMTTLVFERQAAGWKIVSDHSS